MKKWSLMFLTLVMLVPTSIYAHSGHGVFHDSILHYLTSPWHVMPAIVLAIVIVYFWIKKFSRKTR